MKNAKKLFTVPLALCALVCTLVLAACGGPSVEQLIRDDLNESFAQISVENEEFMTAMEEASGDSFEELGVDMETFATAYLDGFGYEIGDISVDEEAGTAEAKVTLKFKSLMTIMSAFASDYQAYIESLDMSTLENEDALYAEAGKLLIDAVKTAKPEDSEATFNYERNKEGEWALTEDVSELMGSMM